MSEPATLAPNVFEFLEKASALYGQMKAQCFSQEMYCNCIERGMESPIEHLFWIACQAVCSANFVKINPEPEYTDKGELTLGSGLFVKPQAKVGSYRVDFKLEWSGYPRLKNAKVVVELDGHAFHDKNKAQRSYEKARDRFLAREGFTVLHFTGSDVCADPFKVVHEVLRFFPSVLIEGDYNPSDPLCQGI